MATEEATLDLKKTVNLPKTKFGQKANLPQTEPARELAAILAGVRRGLEVLVAPAPNPINRSYGEDEMFIG